MAINTIKIPCGRLSCRSLSRGNSWLFAGLPSRLRGRVGCTNLEEFRGREAKKGKIKETKGKNKERKMKKKKEKKRKREPCYQCERSKEWGNQTDFIPCNSQLTVGVALGAVVGVDNG